MTKTIPVNRVEGVLYVQVDDRDFDWVCQSNWQFNGRYVFRQYMVRGKRYYDYMHRLITQAADNQQVDHINGNRLDNRRSNLRVCSPSENSFNRGPVAGLSSKYKGVGWSKAAGKWQVRVSKKIDGKLKTVQVGCFDDEIKAARAYDYHAHLAHGDYAWLNFPEDQKTS